MMRQNQSLKTIIIALQSNQKIKQWLKLRKQNQQYLLSENQLSNLNQMVSCCQRSLQETRNIIQKQRQSIHSCLNSLNYCIFDGQREENIKQALLTDFFGQHSDLSQIFGKMFHRFQQANILIKSLILLKENPFSQIETLLGKILPKNKQLIQYYKKQQIKLSYINKIMKHQNLKQSNIKLCQIQIINDSDISELLKRKQQTIEQQLNIYDKLKEIQILLNCHQQINQGLPNITKIGIICTRLDYSIKKMLEKNESKQNTVDTFFEMRRKNNQMQVLQSILNDNFAYLQLLSGQERDLSRYNLLNKIIEKYRGLDSKLQQMYVKLYASLKDEKKQLKFTKSLKCYPFDKKLFECLKMIKCILQANAKLNQNKKANKQSQLANRLKMQFERQIQQTKILADKQMIKKEQQIFMYKLEIQSLEQKISTISFQTMNLTKKYNDILFETKNYTKKTEQYKKLQATVNQMRQQIFTLTQSQHLKTKMMQNMQNSYLKCLEQLRLETKYKIEAINRFVKEKEQNNLIEAKRQTELKTELTVVEQIQRQQIQRLIEVKANQIAKEDQKSRLKLISNAYFIQINQLDHNLILNEFQEEFSIVEQKLDPKKDHFNPLIKKKASKIKQFYSFEDNFKCQSKGENSQTGSYISLEQNLQQSKFEMDQKVKRLEIYLKKYRRQNKKNKNEILRLETKIRKLELQLIKKEHIIQQNELIQGITEFDYNETRNEQSEELNRFDYFDLDKNDSTTREFSNTNVKIEQIVRHLLEIYKLKRQGNQQKNTISQLNPEHFHNRMIIH